MINSRRHEQRMIGRCTVKGCKHVTSALVEMESWSTIGAYGRNQYICVPNKIVEGAGMVIIDYGRRPHQGPTPSARLRAECPTHQRPLLVKPVNGKHNPDHVCDTRCTSAKGHNCECSCNGLNHGKDHAA